MRGRNAHKGLPPCHGHSTSFLLAGREVRITVLGISIYPRDGADSETLIRNADAALNRAKQAGRECYRSFSPETGGA